MGASLALAGAGCSVRPASQRKIGPYTTQPEHMTPGLPLFYSSAANIAGYGAGVMVRSHEGRPVKVEGNPDHPSSLGGACMHALASVLDLYDPDRSRTITHRGSPSNYEDAINATRKALADQKAKGGAGLRILTGAVTSPTLAGMLDALLKDYPQAKLVRHEPAGRDNLFAGSRQAFGAPLNVTYDFAKADVVLSLDGDFLGCGPGATRYSRDFAGRRKVRKDSHDGGKAEQMSRLYAVETMPTNTGAVADHRLPLLAGQIESFGRALAQELGVAGAPAAGTLPDAAKAWLKPLAADLQRAKGKCVVVPGDHSPASVHSLCHAINSALGNIGQTVFLSLSPEYGPDGKVIDLKTLTAECAEKKVAVLINLGVNAAYTAPADVPFGDALKSKMVPFTLHVGQSQDETAVLCDWHLNEAHYLEAWGDIRGHDGTVTIQQPLIAPLHGGKSVIEFFADVTSAPARQGLLILMDVWRAKFVADKRPGAFEPFWKETLRKGVVADSALKPEAVKLAGDWAKDAKPVPADGEYEIHFRADPTLLDGRYANNGWLQEVPKPVTKITWDNAAFMGKKTAEKLGVAKTYFNWTAGEHGRATVSVVELEFKGRKVLAPVWILPGHAEGAITVHLGHGRDRAGRVGNAADEENAEGKITRGFNAYAIQTSDALASGGGLKVTATSKTYVLACTQGNWAMAEKDPFTGKMLDRKPVRRLTLEEYKTNPKAAKMPPAAVGETELIDQNVPHPHPHGESKEEHAHGDHGGHDHRLIPLTMYKPNESLYPGMRPEQTRRWAMAIDLSACNGCNACQIACQGENNLPVVGKYEVTRGHEMHWLRVDRYYTGNPDNAGEVEAYFQPLGCVQCEKAPCEIVCPVGATAHSSDGLNDMAYNRCVGTRYCSNNCPYKVRRFNFLTFQDWATDTLKLGRNPDVSVRSRGVMEKCTYCVQRIRGAEILAEGEYANGLRPTPEIKDGEIMTACEAACPSGAIVFGDLNQPHSAVGRWKDEPTNYGLLAELNTMPRTSYLAAVRNPNPAMPKGG
jgi:Fe-S-cluster-containing dehydrogenase component/anaerobic selenocysteine-containing dehydrogenase